MANQQNQGRGFAGMDEETHREISSKGGKAAHDKDTRSTLQKEPVAAGRSSHQSQDDSSSHRKSNGQFTSESARDAGHKGGQR